MGVAKHDRNGGPELAEFARVATKIGTYRLRHSLADW